MITRKNLSAPCQKLIKIVDFCTCLFDTTILGGKSIVRIDDLVIMISDGFSDMMRHIQFSLKVMLSLMLDQLVAPVITFGTSGKVASILLISDMASHMIVPISYRGESSEAEVTFVGPLSGMGSLVDAKITPFSESFGALLTCF